jgi:hypothetical protein
MTETERLQQMVEKLRRIRNKREPKSNQTPRHLRPFQRCPGHPLGRRRPPPGREHIEALIAARSGCLPSQASLRDGPAGGPSSSDTRASV